jgi:hypothetical protein
MLNQNQTINGHSGSAKTVGGGRVSIQGRLNGNSLNSCSSHQLSHSVAIEIDSDEKRDGFTNLKQMSLRKSQALKRKPKTFDTENENSLNKSDSSLF